jgi:hypothetical protein
MKLLAVRRFGKSEGWLRRSSDRIRGKRSWNLRDRKKEESGSSKLLTATALKFSTRGRSLPPAEKCQVARYSRHCRAKLICQLFPRNLNVLDFANHAGRGNDQFTVIHADNDTALVGSKTHAQSDVSFCFLLSPQSFGMAVGHCRAVFLACLRHGISINLQSWKGIGTMCS